MADNWEVGDLALCINHKRAHRISSGRIYTVKGIEISPPPYRDAGTLGLHLAEARSHASSGGYRADRFVKVTPPEADQFDREVIEHLTGAPVKERA